jgi:hypothetical protein
MNTNQAWSDKKLTKQERADMAFRYLDWLLTKNVPSGGFRLLHAITQHFNAVNQFHCFPSIEYLAARIERFPSTVWEMLRKLEKIGVIEIEWGRQGSGHPNTYRLPAAFLEFYFGPEKGRLPKFVLPAKKPRLAGVSKPRHAGVSNAPKTPVQPSENTGLPPKKPRLAGESHLRATDSHKEERGTLSLSSDDDRYSASTSTSDDEAFPDAETPSQRASPEALGEIAAAQEQPPRDCLETETGCPGAGGADGGAQVDAEAEFQFLRNLFPNRDDEAGSRLAYFAVLSDSANVHQTVGLLRYGARRYAAHVIERSVSGDRVKTLAQFIETGLWRATNARDAIERAAAGHAGHERPARSSRQ